MSAGIQLPSLRALLQSFPDPPKTLVTAGPQLSSPTLQGSTGSFPPLLSSSASALMSSSSPAAASSSSPSAVVATGLVGEDLALLERAVREELPAQLRDKLSRVLLSRPMLTVERALDSAYDGAKPAALRTGGPGAKFCKEPHVSVSKHFVDFAGSGGGGGGGNVLLDEVVLTNCAQCKAKFRVLLYDEGGLGQDFALAAVPQEGVVKKKASVAVAFRLTLLRPCKVALVAVIAVDAGIRYHIVLKR